MAISTGRQPRLETEFSQDEIGWLTIEEKWHDTGSLKVIPRSEKIPRKFTLVQFASIVLQRVNDNEDSPLQFYLKREIKKKKEINK